MFRQNFFSRRKEAKWAGLPRTEGACVPKSQCELAASRRQDAALLLDQGLRLLRTSLPQVTIRSTLGFGALWGDRPVPPVIRKEAVLHREPPFSLSQSGAIKASRHLWCEKKLTTETSAERVVSEA